MHQLRDLFQLSPKATQVQTREHREQLLIKNGAILEDTVSRMPAKGHVGKTQITCSLGAKLVDTVVGSGS